jgi:prolipoprotein diacylglyceryltransferase
MWDEAFILVLMVGFLFFARWAFSALPGEEWQIMASVPLSKKESGEWAGMNLTYYGVFVAVSCVLAVAVFLLLMGAVGCRARISILAVTFVLGSCIPASRVLARLVEKKPHTLTVGGASFFGLLIAPWIIWGIQEASASGINDRALMLPAMAALSIAYAIGEGIGRLACISFGCCYGRPLNRCHSLIRRVIGRNSFVFAGATKKIAYESGLEGEKVVPIQAITSVLYVCVGLVSMLFYLKGHYGVALAISVIVTQSWRACSETLRADYRGDGSISAYQIMAVVAVFYAIGLLLILPAGTEAPANLNAGLQSLWDPMVPPFLQLLGIAVFLFSGRSKVTGASLSFHVFSDRL